MTPQADVRLLWMVRTLVVALGAADALAGPPCVRLEPWTSSRYVLLPVYLVAERLVSGVTWGICPWADDLGGLFAAHQPRGAARPA